MPSEENYAKCNKCGSVIHSKEDGFLGALCSCGGHYKKANLINYIDRKLANQNKRIEKLEKEEKNDLWYEITEQVIHDHSEKIKKLEQIVFPLRKVGTVMKRSSVAKESDFIAFDCVKCHETIGSKHYYFIHRDCFEKEEPNQDKYWGSCQQAIDLAVRKERKEFVEDLKYFVEHYALGVSQMEYIDKIITKNKYSEEKEDD